MDLFFPMVFLRFYPFSTKSYWDDLVQCPIARGNANGLSRLQALMATVSLRRTKEKIHIVLPPKTIRMCNVALSAEERKLYDDVEARAKIYVENYIAKRSVTKNHSMVISIISWLRHTH
ncbi:putative SWI/SNF-related matrix-associated actin-dependent regulator of chromatin subfamily A member 3-like 1 [Helianthus annuus]|uniref:putative SWI/SNF-related matrix-associated actin-dependent regulator of chromatin subfamily A member 3-like 1 n=1 Tax=Helianthus annuus TaxID=4232 RepID=UPI000B909432|nr:putative SWI/SNF-related matrix-associated actin-dependent regulator of chromatin subfamily A member 3-like 1 [Helianthus annuus]